MADPVSKVIKRFPESEQTIRLLQETNSKFGNLCQEYATINDKLNALRRMNDLVVTAYESTLRQQCVAIEEELLTVIEGYRPD